MSLLGERNVSKIYFLLNKSSLVFWLMTVVFLLELFPLIKLKFDMRLSGLIIQDVFVCWEDYFSIIFSPLSNCDMMGQGLFCMSTAARV